jgi:RNA polymerase sigma-70 factor, ECF subfamily
MAQEQSLTLECHQPDHVELVSQSVRQDIGQRVASDEQLMLCFRDGNDTAFGTLYARHKGPLYRYFLRAGLPSAHSEDLLQDVWLSLIRTRETYKVKAKFTSLLYKMAYNRFMDHIRRQNVMRSEGDKPLESLPAPLMSQPERVFEQEEKQRALEEAVMGLTEKLRQVFILRIDSELSLYEISEILDIPYETVKSRYRYAAERLAQHLN